MPPTALGSALGGPRALCPQTGSLGPSVLQFLHWDEGESCPPTPPSPWEAGSPCCVVKDCASREQRLLVGCV